MKGVIDRIENEIVVLEIGSDYFEFPLEKFPKEIKEGDLVESKNGLFNILVDETLIKEKEIRTLFDSLLEDSD